MISWRFLEENLINSEKSGKKKFTHYQHALKNLICLFCPIHNYFFFKCISNIYFHWHIYPSFKDFYIHQFNIKPLHGTLHSKTAYCSIENCKLEEYGEFRLKPYKVFKMDVLKVDLRSYEHSNSTKTTSIILK